MRPITTIILFLLALGAAGYIVLFERKQLTTEQAADRSGVLFDFPEDEVSKIEITNAAGRIMMERVSGGWNLTVPVKDRADGGAVKELLKLARGTEVIERLPGDRLDDKKKLKEMGLDAAHHAKVVLYRAGQDAATVMIGKAAAYEGAVYMQADDGRKKDNEQVLVARVPWQGDVLGRSPGEWRDPRLVTAAPDAIYKVAVKGPEGLVELERDRAPVPASQEKPGLMEAKEMPLWRITKPLAERADQDLVADYLLPGLINARAQSFLDAAPASAAPVVSVTVWSEGGPEQGETLEIATGQEPEVALVSLPGRPGWARGPADLLALRLCTLDRMRDPKLAALDAKRLTTIIIKDAEKGETPLYLVNRQWCVAHEGLVYEGNRERIQSLVTLLNETAVLEWQDQPAGLEEYGLDAPMLDMIFGSAAHAARSQPTLPDPQNSVRLRIGQKQNRFYAQWEGRPTVMRFDGSVLGNITRDWIQYKSTRLLSFAPLSLRQLSLWQPPSPPLELSFDLASGAQWKALRQGTDLTAHLDRPQLERLVNWLSELSAHGWVADPAAGLEALKNPALVVQVAIEQFDEQSGAPQTVPVLLSFAPIAEGQRTALYYGRLNEENAVFLIRRELLEQLSTPVLTQEAAAK